MKDAFSIVVIVFLFSFVIISLVTLGEEGNEKNVYLDNESKVLLNNLSKEYNTKFYDLAVAEQEEAGEGLDPYEKEFETRSAQSTGTLNFLDKILYAPDIILYTAGVPRTTYVQSIVTMILSFLGIVLIVVGYRALFGGGKLTQN